MQERFNKDLEEIKKSQYIMNNTINEIKNTLEGTKSRITETKDRISEVKDRMVATNEIGRKKRDSGACRGRRAPRHGQGRHREAGRTEPAALGGGNLAPRALRSPRGPDERRRRY